MGATRVSYRKFRNHKTNGYDSKREAKRAAELQLLERVGAIKNLVYQPEFELIPKQDGERAVKYRADFGYYDNEKRETIVEDAKGFKTRDYIIKRKLMKFLRGITVKEI